MRNSLSNTPDIPELFAILALSQQHALKAKEEYQKPASMLLRKMVRAPFFGVGRIVNLNCSADKELIQGCLKKRIPRNKDASMWVDVKSCEFLEGEELEAAEVNFLYQVD